MYYAAVRINNLSDSVIVLVIIAEWMNQSIRTLIPVHPVALQAEGKEPSILHNTRNSIPPVVHGQITRLMCHGISYFIPCLQIPQSHLYLSSETTNKQRTPITGANIYTDLSE